MCEQKKESQPDLHSYTGYEAVDIDVNVFINRLQQNTIFKHLATFPTHGTIKCLRFNAAFKNI